MKKLSGAMLGIALLMSSCTSLLPDDLDSLGDDVTMTITNFSPYIGRITTYENIVEVSNRSTLPINFKIMGLRTVDGVPAPELLEKHPVKVWKGFYTGNEQSIQEIEDKRGIEYRPILDMQENNGDIIFWNSGNISSILTQPNEGYVFDVEMANTGGRRYTRDVIIQPRKPRDYEPSQYDDILGLARMAFVRPTEAMNIFGEKTGMPSTDIRTYIFEDTENTAPGNTLTISVLDSLGNTIDITKFSDTDFDNLVHGFNPRFVDGKVTYDVAYPIPLINYPTRYTNIAGDRAALNLRYSRLGRGGILQHSYLLLHFAIYREGHWEIQFRFNGESPDFENDNNS